MATTNEQTGLKQTIGFLGLVAMSVGLNIGGAIFALTTIAAHMTGPSLPLALLIACIPALLGVVPYSVLMSSLPVTAGSYRYLQLISPKVALVSSSTLIVCILIGAQPLFALAFGKYLTILVPVNPIISGLVVLTFFYILNLLGIGPVTQLQSLMLFLLLAALCLFVVMGFPEIEAARFTNLFPKGAGGLLAASGLLFTFCGGGFFAMDLGGEVIRANRTLPKALLLGILIVVIINLLVMFVVVGAAGPETLKETNSLIHVGKLFMPGPALLFFVIAGALLACATTINAVFTILGRIIMAIAEDDLYPQFLGRVSQRFGTPYLGLTVSFIVSALSLIFIPSLKFYGSMLNLAIVVTITLVTISSLKFLKKYPELCATSSFNISPLLVRIACICVIVINLLILVFFIKAIGKATLVYLGIAVCSAFYAFARQKLLQVVKISEIFPALNEV